MVSVGVAVNATPRDRRGGYYEVHREPQELVKTNGHLKLAV